MVKLRCAKRHALKGGNTESDSAGACLHVSHSVVQLCKYPPDAWSV